MEKKMDKYRLSRKARWLLLLGLTVVLALVFLFVFYTSEDLRWGSGYWAKWLISRFQMDDQVARNVVNGIRKTLHFLGYGGIGLLCWVYFYLWGVRKPLVVGLVLTGLVAVLDEVTQSMTAFRFGKPQDVVLDLVGAVVVTGVVRWLGARNNKES